MSARTLFVALAALSAGCAPNPRHLPQQFTVNPLGEGRFEVEISAARYAATGGKGNAEFDKLLRAALDGKGLCRSGYEIADPIVLQRHVSVVGRCT